MSYIPPIVESDCPTITSSSRGFVLGIGHYSSLGDHRYANMFRKGRVVCGATFLVTSHVNVSVLTIFPRRFRCYTSDYTSHLVGDPTTLRVVLKSYAFSACRVSRRIAICRPCRLVGHPRMSRYNPFGRGRVILPYRLGRMTRFL